MELEIILAVKMLTAKGYSVFSQIWQTEYLKKLFGKQSPKGTIFQVNTPGGYNPSESDLRILALYGLEPYRVGENDNVAEFILR